MPTLFDNLYEESLRGQEPLAYRLRPKKLDDVCGQRHLVGKAGPLRSLIENRMLLSAVFWGPPGTGKTTVATILAQGADAQLERLNAAHAGAKDLRAVAEKARNRLRHGQGATLLFFDEIHRLNRNQQDILLPEIEDGTYHLIGATTKDPRFSLTPPLRSRLSIFEFHLLGEEDILQGLHRAIQDSTDGLGGKGFEPPEDILSRIVIVSDGDLRGALMLLNLLYFLWEKRGEKAFEEQGFETILASRPSGHDILEDDHFDQISAMIKSVRGSDPDAALYWAGRLLEGGEDPQYLFRRLVILSSEDIGNANPQALPLALAGLQAGEQIGMPEVRIILGQVITYLSASPKSNRSYLAIDKALGSIRDGLKLSVPSHLKNKGAERARYQYPHSSPSAFLSQDYFGSDAHVFYSPTDRGEEKELKEYLEKCWPARYRKGQEEK